MPFFVNHAKNTYGKIREARGDGCVEMKYTGKCVLSVRCYHENPKRQKWTVHEEGTTSRGKRRYLDFESKWKECVSEAGQSGAGEYAAGE